MTMDVKLVVSISENCTAEFDVVAYEKDGGFAAEVNSSNLIAYGKTLKEALLDLKAQIIGQKKLTTMKSPPLSF